MRSLETATVCVVVPAFNEADSLPALVAALQEAFAGGPGWRLLVVDDGSTDTSKEVLAALRSQDERINYLSFSRNFGHQEALRAGLDHAVGDCVITMDADLQHPPQLIRQMLQLWNEGYDVVQTVREEDASLSTFKRRTSSAFYRLLNRLSDVPVGAGHADFRLLDRQVVDALRRCREQSLFLRGLVPWLGFQHYLLPYKPARRHAGTTKYSLRKMIRLAINGLVSFSIRPLYAALALGVAMTLLSFGYFFYALTALLLGEALPGWTSLIGTVLLIGGLQLFILGVMGVYVGKIFIEVKQRPQYIIRQRKE